MAGVRPRSRAAELRFGTSPDGARGFFITDKKPAKLIEPAANCIAILLKYYSNVVGLMFVLVPNKSIS